MRYTVHFQHPLPSAFPHSFGRAVCQEDNTMTESEVRVVRAQRGTSQGWEGQWRAACPALLLYQVCRMSSEQNNQRWPLKLSTLVHKHECAFPPPPPPLLKVNLMSTRNKTVNKTTIIGLLSKHFLAVAMSWITAPKPESITQGCSEVASPLFSQFFISASLLSPTPLFSLCWSIMQYQAHMVHFRDRYF